MSLLGHLGLNKLDVGPVEPVPEAQPAVTCMKPVQIKRLVLNEQDKKQLDIKVTKCTKAKIF